MTARRSGTSLWQYIADAIAQEIRDRVFAPGDRLPE
jgi:DNA-binding GntR family transcriptional regulator